ncbi:MAG: bactofilin family protein [Cellulosilyticaceae bacterium]
MRNKGEKLGTVETLIAMDVELTGDLVCEKSIRIEGKIKGNISSKGKVIIGEKALIEGNIHAKSIVVYGKIEGNVEVQDSLEIMETGELYGELIAPKLYVALGGIVCGQSKMKKQIVTEEKQGKKAKIA